MTHDAREHAFARAVVRVMLPLGALCALTATLLRGIPGLVITVGTFCFVTAVYAGTAWLQARAGRSGMAAVHAATLGGFFTRLAIYAAIVPVLQGFFAAAPGPGEAAGPLHDDRYTLAIVGVVAIIGALAAEWWTAWSRPELWWLSLPDDDGSRPTIAHTRDDGIGDTPETAERSAP